MLGAVVLLILFAGAVLPAQSTPQASVSAQWERVARGQVDSDYAAVIAKLLDALESGSPTLPSDLSISEGKVVHVSSITSRDSKSNTRDLTSNTRDLPLNTRDLPPKPIIEYISSIPTLNEEVSLAPEFEQDQEPGKVQVQHRKWLPAAASQECQGNLDGHSAEVYIIPTRCYKGFARHSNGRCYRVVDEPIQLKRPYNVTRVEGCLGESDHENKEELEAQGRLDVCDEYGGCKPGSAGYPSFLNPPKCREGFVLDSNDICRRSFTVMHDIARRPPKQGRGKRDVSSNQSAVIN